jgi:hypothetical protein
MTLQSNGFHIYIVSQLLNYPCLNHAFSFFSKLYSNLTPDHPFACVKDLLGSVLAASKHDKKVKPLHIITEFKKENFSQPVILVAYFATYCNPPPPKKL